MVILIKCGYTNKMTTKQSQVSLCKNFSSEIIRTSNNFRKFSQLKQSHGKGHLSCMTFKVRYKLFREKNDLAQKRYASLLVPLIPSCKVQFMKYIKNKR